MSFVPPQSDQQLDCALDLMRRLPPQQIEKNLSDLIDLVRTFFIWFHSRPRHTLAFFCAALCVEFQTQETSSLPSQTPPLGSEIPSDREKMSFIWWSFSEPICIDKVQNKCWL